MTKLASDGQSLVYSTFLGGSDRDRGRSIAVENGYAYLTGYTVSTGFPVINAYDSTYNGVADCFVSILSDDSDSDNLSNWEEDFLYGTDPLVADTDLDGYLDGIEILYGTDPLDPNDYPGATTTTTTTTTSSQPTDELPPVVLLIVIGGVGAVVIVVIVFTIGKRRSNS